MQGKTGHQFKLSFGGTSPVEAAVQVLATSGVESRGAIFTRREVVDFILDLVGYTPEKSLHEGRILEPCVGNGDFLLPIVERLLQSWTRSKVRTNPALALKDSVRGVELHHDTLAATKAALVDLLIESGLSRGEARTLADAWLSQGDFLLSEHGASYDFVVGNPPYVRQEMVPDVLIQEYRARYSTIYDRADLYVPFIEHGLSLLAKGGKLGFICADRWMKNKYGRPLRELVAKNFHFETHVDMVGTPAFHTEVMAYPAIFVLSNTKAGPTRIASRPIVSKAVLEPLAVSLTTGSNSPEVTEIAHIAASAEPWALENFEKLAIVRRLERELPLLEEAGCKVGIGVATGADKVFVAQMDALDVEGERKIPLVMTRDIKSGQVAWRGYGVLNPFGEDGKLVRLEDFPRFAKYLERHGEAIKSRHVSQKNPDSWYRTIDRIYPSLTLQPKLLIPDIKGQAHIVFEEGKYYPHHNLYFVTSNDWDLEVLKAVLQSRIGQLFIETYSTRMRGGYLRFQAQYLRRIRLPFWKNVGAATRKALRKAAQDNDLEACNEITAKLYGLSKVEQAIINEHESA